MMARFLHFIGKGANGLILGLALLFALVALNWVGFIASDDVTYAHGAYGWIEHFPFVGGHGTIRYTITIPMALAFRLFGESEFALVLPSLAYFTGFLALAWAAVRRVAGPQAAFGALLLLVTLPLFVIQASIANVDAIELFFLGASVFLFWRCLDQGPTTARLLGTGALAGLAFLTRETAIFIAVFYGLCFLAGHRFSRLRYLWIAAGFLAVWSVELVYLTVMTGDPLYRFNISAHHDATIDRSIDLAGNVIVHPLVDPLLVLLLNQEFMLLFVVAPPLMAWLAFGKAIEPRLRHFARILCLFALSWFVCVGAAQHLLPLNPRYFTVCAAVACILAGIALARLAARPGRGRLLAGVLALALLGTNWVGFYVENKQSQFGERKLAELAKADPNLRLTTDPMTLYRADLLLRWAKAQPRVSADPPAPGSLYFYNPAYADKANFKMPAAAQPLYAPRRNWLERGRYAPRPTWLAQALEATGIAPALPPRVWRKLRYHHPEVVLYRVR